MIREECEALIANKLKEIFEVYKQYDEDAKYLSLCVDDGGDYLEFNNNYWENETIKKVLYAERGGKRYDRLR